MCACVTPDHQHHWTTILCAIFQVAFQIRRFSRKELRKHQLKADIYINSLRNVTITHTLPKSESCDSLNIKVSSSFSGPLPTYESGIINDDQVGVCVCVCVCVICDVTEPYKTFMVQKQSDKYIKKTDV